MTLNRESLHKWAQATFINISAEQEAAILQKFGSEQGDSHEWSEQDIWEQVRKILR